MDATMKLLMNALGRGGMHPVDPTQPWNPAAGMGMASGMNPIPAASNLAQTKAPVAMPESFLGKVSMAVMPQTTQAFMGVSPGDQSPAAPDPAGAKDTAMKPTNFMEKVGMAVMPQTTQGLMKGQGVMSGKGGAS